MILRLTYLNDEYHQPEFFGQIFATNKAAERPNKGETLITVTNEKYLVKDILVKTEEIEWCGKKRQRMSQTISWRKSTASPSGNVH